jgi:hypothetical protein
MARIKLKARRGRFVSVAGTLLLLCLSHAHAQGKFVVTATAAQVAQACGTADIKLVFAVRDSLYYVDFSETTPHIAALATAGPAYLPVISPDGNWVAYQSGSNAESPSSLPAKPTSWMRELSPAGTPIKIADTAFVPRFVQNMPPDSPTIIYATSVACPAQACFSDGQTLKKTIVNKTPGLAQTVFAHGSYYGGLSWDGRYLNTAWDGGPNAFMLDLQGNTGMPQSIHTMRVKKNVTNVDTFVTVGSCNPSRSASRLFDNTMLYFDFSSAAITAAKCNHPLLGTWGMHQLLFLSRYDAEDLRVYAMPADRPIIPVASATGVGEAVGKQWNNPEWSNHPYYAVASLLVDRLWSVSGSWNHTTNTESIYLVNLKDSVYLKLVESTDTSYTSTTTFENPFIWVQVPVGFAEDTGWLKQTIWERAGMGVVNPFSPSLRSMQNSLQGSHAEVAIYSLTGQKLAVYRGAQNSAVTIQEKLQAMKSGTYLVVGHGEGGRLQAYRWVNIR